ncbi:hypothetical protein BD769DRAFT_1668464 [Suillus cothurnatus]|nr:hypothetical protein BD769DRAFT_1668464 [Suillus cothurnatus]
MTPHTEDQTPAEMDLDDDDLEPGEILDQSLGLSEGEPDDSPMLTRASHPLVDSDNNLYSDLNSPLITFPLLPANLHLSHSVSCPAARPANTNQLPDILLDSPPRNTTWICSHTVAPPPDSPSQHTNNNFFTDMEYQPEPSGGEGIENVMKSLMVQSCKASGSSLRGQSPATSTRHNAGPSSEAASCSASESHKWPHDLGAEVTKKLNDASDSLILHMQDKSDSKALSKRMKFDYARFSKELKACKAYAEHEHDVHRFIASHSHECAMSEEKTRQLELEI